MFKPADSTVPTAGVDTAAAAERGVEMFREGAGLQPQQWWEVLSPPVELAAKIKALLPRTGILTPQQLEQLAAEIAATPELWEPLVIRDENRRRYRLMFENDDVDIWMLCWMPGQDTGFHDHGRSAVGVAGAHGCVEERQMLLPTGATSVELRPGVNRHGTSSYIHSVKYGGEGEPAVTVHAYSPPLEEVGQYRVDDDGVMRREIVHGRQELLDHTIVQVDPDRS